MFEQQAWEPPSPASARIIVEVAESFLERAPELIADIEHQLLPVLSTGIREDPALMKAVYESSRSNVLHWTRAQTRQPGRRVAPNVAPEVVDLAIDVVRRGLEDASMDFYRFAQHIHWRVWSAVVFETVRDVSALPEILTTTHDSLAAFVHDTVGNLRSRIQEERELLRSDSYIERLRAVTLLLGGSPISDSRAVQLLRYDLNGPHHAAVLWSDSGAQNPSTLERLADTLTHTARPGRVLTVRGSSSVLWAWWQSDAALDTDHILTALTEVPTARVAVGSTGTGRDGFRRTHLDARAVQQIMLQMARPRQFVSYTEVEPVALLAHDTAEASAFVKRTLGQLEAAPRELRETLRVYLREQSSPSKAARVLYSHRNTVVSKVSQAHELLPPESSRFPLNVELALEIDHWLG